jgi:LacI family transcriptional regulator
MVTLKSIAEKAGVSVGTVSIALGLNSARQRLRPATRESVLAAAAELGYRRNAYAQGLASGHTAVVGFVCWSFSEWHNAQLFEGLAEDTW